MYFSLIMVFVLLLLIIVTGAQNNVPVDLKFITWKLHISLTALTFYSSITGAAIVAILTLPKLVSKYLKVRGLTKEKFELKKKIVEMEKQSVGNSRGK
ncbi:MAG: LapA family protein [Thermodesulfobacteriota bacterium]|nr:LapA family protein [Thermodesulfobacteriota bacterium]